MDHLPLSTFTISVQGLGVIIKTLALHFIKKKEIVEEVPARGDLLFDEAFCVVKHFFERASLSTVEQLQQFGNNFTPSPYYVRVIKVTIPISTRIEAGKILISSLGEKEIKDVIGGREWWQRTLQKDGGVNGEWISMKSDWDGLDDDSSSNNNNNNNTPESSTTAEKLRKEKLKAMKAAAEVAEKELRKAEKENLKPKGKGKGKGKEEEEVEETSTEAEEKTEENNQDENEEENYSPEMDDMKCTLAIHGGGGFFGSINSHRYIYWRLARKTTGRIFAVSYRLSPQFPFPCALSDALAAYLYLIKPPKGAKHRAVDPSKLTIIGDSFGGNICLALLCLIRDSGLPPPAGAVLVSPWCDLTHSFPSILTNTETDVVPPYGFLFKPSTLWPPPPKEFQDRANTSTSLPHLREIYLERQEEKKIRKASSFLSFGRKKKFNHLNSSGDNSNTSESSIIVEGKDSNNEVAEKKGDELANVTKSGLGDNPIESEPQKAEGKNKEKEKEKKVGGGGKGEVEEIFKVKVDGEDVEIDSQIQLYATNDQLVYPFVSPIWQPSLGGLPPLYILAGDKEVLRDEIVYMAHRAANPAKYPIRQALLDANPERTRLAKTYGPTKVHLQIYDSAPHDLPLFSFTTPAKFCYRAMSSFINFVTTSEVDSPESISQKDTESPTSTSANANANLTIPTSKTPESRSRSNSIISSLLPSKGPKASQTSIGLESTIYSSSQPFNRPDYVDNMIRERVAIDGVVRTMEPVDQVEILKLDPEEIGLIREAPVKRYLAGKALWDKRFKKAYQRVQKRREHHLTKSMVEETDRIRKRYEKSGSNSSTAAPSLPTLLENEEERPVRSSSPEPIDSEEPIEGIWNLHGERPPPSSIAARKDTSEARKLAHVLDTHYSAIHSLHLWTGVNTVAEGNPKHQDSQMSE